MSTHGTGPEEQAAEVLAAHDWLTPRGYAWPCCTCGEEFPDGEDAAYAHVADALAPLFAEHARQAAAEALRNPYDDDGYCALCGNGSWKAHGPECAWADLRDARAEGWDEGWDARAKYIGTDGTHYRARNPYRERADTYAEGGEQHG